MALFEHRKNTIIFNYITSLLFVFVLRSTLQLNPAQSPSRTTHDTDNFIDLRLNNVLFVDKSLLVEEFLQYDGTYYARTVVRPKGWGKSTNLNMLEKFFEIEVDEKGDLLPIDETINDKLFLGGTVEVNQPKPEVLKPLKIASTNATKHLGKHPVILLRLQNASGANYQELETKLKSCVVDVFRRHKYLSQSSKISQKERFEKYLGGDFNSTELLVSLNFLALRLKEHFELEVIVLVDDYDIPLISAYREFKTGTRQDSVKVERLLEHLLDGARKRTIYHPPGGDTSTATSQSGTGVTDADSTASNSSKFEDHTSNATPDTKSNFAYDPVNEKWNLAMLAGVLDLSFENTEVKGVLHFDRVYTLFDKPFSQFFGLTNEEVRDVLARAPTLVDPRELRLWYDGYPQEMKVKSPLEPNQGTSQVETTTHFYNTRSVMRCLLGRYGVFDYYGDPILADGPIEKMLSSDPMQELVQQLLCGETYWMNAYPYFTSSVRWLRAKIPEVLSDHFTLLVFNGFLSSCESAGPRFGPRLGLSNKETRRVFQVRQMQWVFDKFRTSREEFHTFAGSLYTGLIEQFEESLQKYLGKASEFIRKGEDKAKISYNGLMVALRTNLENVNLTSESKRWDGKGNDIFFTPRLGHSKIAIVLRYAIAKEEANLTQVAETELEQINKLYIWSNGSLIENRYPHVRKIIKLGIAFCAEKVKIKFENDVTSFDIL